MRKLLAMIMTAAMVLSVMGTAAAAPPESDVVSRPDSAAGFVYRGSGVIVLTGPTEFEQGCQGLGFTEPESLLVQAPSGVVHQSFSVDGEGIVVFEDTAGPAVDDVFAWIGEACTALFDGDPETVAPEPIAVGEGRTTQIVRVDRSGVAHVKNWITGRVETTAGDGVHLNAMAKFTDDGSVPDIQMLRVNYGG